MIDKKTELLSSKLDECLDLLRRMHLHSGTVSQKKRAAIHVPAHIKVDRYSLE